MNRNMNKSFKPIFYNYNKFFGPGRGFTLIELLIVVAIIGLLSAVVLVSLNSARRSANDARRKADLKQMANAMEMYYNTNNAYPAYADETHCSFAGCITGCTIANWSGSGLGLTTWLAAPPNDPVNNATYCYAIPDAKNDANSFCIVARQLQGPASTTGYYVAHNGAGTTSGIAIASTCPT